MPEFIFLFIGDGMGEVQVEAAERAKIAKTSKGLVFTSFPVKGWQKTSSANAKITDSAAAATAIACGQKTNNGMLGVDPDSKELPTIAEIAHEKGWKIGILTSVSLDHATPAGFYAKVKSRKEYASISRAFANSTFEYFGGGGLEGQKSEDEGKDNLQLAIENGFSVVRTREDLDKKAGTTKKIFAFNHRLAGGASLPWALDLQDDDIRLSEFTKAAIRNLSDSKFFMTVEGGKIDWACHSNDLAGCVMETLEFNNAVQEAFNFYTKNPSKTLIIVTADHETGGLKKLRKSQIEILFSLKKSSEKIASDLKNLQNNNATFNDALSLLKNSVSTEFDDKDLEMLKKAWDDTISGVENKSLYEKESPIISILNSIISEKAGFQFTSKGHTSADVPVYAIGAGADDFSGTYENTEIFVKMQKLMNLGSKAK